MAARQACSPGRSWPRAPTNDFSMKALQEYEDAWRDNMEDKLWRDWMAKEKLITISTTHWTRS